MEKKDFIYYFELQTEYGPLYIYEKYKTDPTEKFNCEIKIRNLHLPAKAQVQVNPDGSFTANFEAPQMSITAGQSAVLYQEDVVLGGGIIL